MRKRQSGKILLGSFIIFIGIILLLVNTGIISTEINQLLAGWYPILFCLFGLWLLFRPLFTYKRISLFWGLAFLIYGILLIGGLNGYWDYRWSDFWKLWPLILVYLGFDLFLFKQVKFFARIDRKHDNDSDFAKSAAQKARKQSVYKMAADIKLTEPNWVLDDLDYWYMAGDYTIDVTQAYIPDRPVRIRLSGWVGDVNLTLPEELEFSIEAHAKVLGFKMDGSKEEGVGRHVNFETEGFREAERRLEIILDFSVLDARIDRI